MTKQWITYAITNLVVAEEENTNPGRGWLSTPLDQMINPMPDLGQLTTMRDIGIKEKTRHHVMNKSSKEKSRKAKSLIAQRNARINERPCVVTDHHVGRSIYSIWSL